jgi:DNA topoisomerase-1
MSKLLIVESPGKIKKIQEYLGPDYIVMASIGHIIDLDQKTMSIDMETFEPFYYQYPDKIDVIKKLKSATIKVGKQNVYLAADEDREGEMIAWSLQRELDIHKGKRIVFNSITEKELTNAVKNHKLVDLNMVYAQQARRILDRLAGYLISPLLNKNGFKGAQSAGRVQSVVVKIIVDKEKEIEEFYKTKKSTYFYISCLVSLGEHEVLTKLVKSDTDVELTEKDEFDENDDTNPDELDGNNIEKKSKEKAKTKKGKVNTENAISSKSYLTFDKSQEEQVVKIIKAMCKGDYSILDIKEKTKKSNGPAPFTTSTLQQFASQRLGMDAKRTMSVAQKLYEGGHITYMRTDSTSISEEAIKGIKQTIKDKYGETYFEAHQFINKKANTQEAHECIRPTKPAYLEIEGTSDEKRLYTAIWKRTIQSQMKAAEYQSLLVEIKISDKKQILDPYKLVGTLENLIYEGYLIVDGKKGSKPIEKKNLKKLEWIEINGQEDTLKPPPRYNDASLINKMDPKNLNIGRPSTYASFIDKITKRGYVDIKDVEGTKLDVTKYIAKASNPKVIDVESKEIVIGKEKKKLVPTALGTNITAFLELNFPMIMDYKFTANMEKELDDVAEGTVKKIKIVKDFYAYLEKQIGNIKPIENKLSDGIILGKTNLGIEVKLSNGKYGKYLICGDKNLNLKYLLANNPYKITEQNIELNTQALMELVNKKLDNDSKTNLNNTGNSNGNSNANSNANSNGNSNENSNENSNKKEEPKIYKEWVKGKTKYNLKSGQYGYYLEEIGSTGKKTNWSMGFLIKKVAKDNLIDDIDENIVEITNKISIQDLQSNIEYLKNMKKNNKKK